VALLRELHRFTGTGALVFPNAKHRHRMIAPMSINKALERLVSHRTVTGHDFRATASTLLNEAGFRTNAIELQLAHVVASQTERAYNHADYLDERRIMVQWYANKLQGLPVKNPINYDLLLAA
jgi:integrase